MLDQDVDGLTVLFVLLVDHERLLVQSMLGSDLRDFGGVVILQLVDVSNDLTLVCTDGGKEQEVLQIAVVAEGRGLDNDLLQQLDEFQREICFEEGMDCNGDIVRVGAFWQDSGNNLWTRVSQHLGRRRGRRRVSPDRSKRDDERCLIGELEPKDPPRAS